MIHQEIIWSNVRGSNSKNSFFQKAFKVPLLAIKLYRILILNRSSCTPNSKVKNIYSF